MRAPAALIASLALATGVAACGGGSSHSTSTTTASTGPRTSSTHVTGPIGFEGVPIEPGAVLAPNTTGTGDVHGISCGPTEQLAYHIHVHLLVFVEGKPRALPGGIGIPGSTVQNTAKGPYAFGGQCIYWLHTHAPDGVIHIESPTQTIYSLGEFFDEWHQPLSGDEVAGSKGPVTAIVNGRPWTGNPRSIPLDPHAVIQLDVGKPARPFENVNWGPTGL